MMIGVALAVFCASCGDFLDEYSQNKTYVNSVSDLDELLLGDGYILASDVNLSDYPGRNLFEFLHLLSDESREVILRNSYGLNPPGGDKVYVANRGFWSWAQEPFTNVIGTVAGDPYWQPFYVRIACLNNILDEAKGFTDLSDRDAQTLARVTGEAYFLRAWNYFMLANLYGAAYDKSNPEDGASVILKLTPQVVFDKAFRDHTGDVYRQIVSDLKEAVAHFAGGDTKDAQYRANASAAWALLSRVYLYMEEYSLAVEAADEVEGYALFNLAVNYVPGSGKSFLNTASPEVIFIQGAYGGIARLHKGSFFLYSPPPTPLIYADCYGVAEELQQLFDANDIRSSAFFARTYGSDIFMCRKVGSGSNLYETDPITGQNVYTTDVGSSESFGECISIRYAEVLLNKAEALACLNEIGPATAAIRELLNTRYVAAPAVPAGQMDLIAFIRKERQKELCFEGHRWFDLRRYAVNSVAPVATTVVHEYADPAMNAVAGCYTLRPYSAATRGGWLLPLPSEVLDYNFPNITNFDREAGVTQTIY